MIATVHLQALRSGQVVFETIVAGQALPSGLEHDGVSFQLISTPAQVAATGVAQFAVR